MPLSRYKIRNEYGLADPELYREADKDDPEALLEGVAMAGLVGVLRQLGDLAEFAAEIFHNLHVEVTSTAARGHSLIARVQQLEAEFPSVEKALLSQTNHASLFSSPGIDWHPHLRYKQNPIIHGDLPRFVMDSYEECRGPPRLFLLDKFDVAGAGACLKRYTDPSFFKLAAESAGAALAEVQREKKTRKVKKKGSRWRNGDTPKVLHASRTKLQELFLEEHIENRSSDPERVVKLKKRQLNGSALYSKDGKSYMEKFLVSPSREGNVIRGASVFASGDSIEPQSEIIDIATVSVVKKIMEGDEIACSPLYEHELVPTRFIDQLNQEDTDREIVTVVEQSFTDVTGKIFPPVLKVAVDLGDETVDFEDGDDAVSEVDNYVDALATIESETETDVEYRTKNNLSDLNVGINETGSDVYEEQLDVHGNFSDSQLIENSSLPDHGNSSFNEGGSNFSCASTQTNLNENALADGKETANVVPCTEGTIFKSIESAHEHAVSEYKSTEEENVSCIGEDSNTTLIGTCSPVTSLLVSELDEAPPTFSKDGAESISIVTEAKMLVDSSTSLSVSPFSSKERDGFLVTALAESGRIHDGNQSVLYDNTSVRLLYISELASEKRCLDDLEKDELQSAHAEDNCTNDLVSEEIGLHLEKLQLAIPAETLSGSSVVVDPPGTARHADSLSQDTGVNLESLTLVDPIQQVLEIEETESSSVIDDDVSQTVHALTEVSVPYDEEVKGSEVTCKTSVGDEIGAFASCWEMTRDDVSSQHLSTCVRKEGRYDNESIEDVLDETSSENDEALCATTAASADVDDVSSVTNPSLDLASAPTSNFTDAQTSMHGVCHPESGVENSVFQTEVSPKDIDCVTSDSVHYEKFNAEMLEDRSCMYDQNQNSVPDVTSTTPSPEPGNLQMESKYSSLQVSNDDIFLFSCSPRESEISFDQSFEFQAGQQDFESLHSLHSHKTSSSSLNLQDSSNSLLLEQLQEFHVEQSVDSLLPTDLSSSIPLDSKSEQMKAPLESASPSFGILLDTANVSLEEVPPLPPQPPMLWLGKQPTAFQLSQSEIIEPSEVPIIPLIQPSLDVERAVSNLSEPEKEIVPIHNPSSSSIHHDEKLNDASKHSGHDELASNSYVEVPIETPEHVALDLEGELMSSDSGSFKPVSAEDHETVLTQGISDQPLNRLEPQKVLPQSSEGEERNPVDVALLQPSEVKEQHQREYAISQDAMLWPSNAFCMSPTYDGGKSNGSKLPRPRNPLIDAVNAHGKSKLRKVTDRIRPRIEPEADERDSLLEQIRNKSFNLKPAAVTRPSIQGPKTNLQVAAILAKANAIRQAFAGSDDDEDVDSWSDS